MNEYGFRHFASRESGAAAIIELDDTTWSRGALLELADGIARGFVAAGLVPGDVLAIVAPNCAEYVAAYLAGISAGRC